MVKPIRAPKSIRLTPVRPNIGIQEAYQRRLDRLIAQMQRDTERTVRAAWKANPPEMARDESPAAGLRAAMGRLGREWSARFAEFASTWGRKFARDAAGAADRTFAAALRKAGFTVRFSMTREVNDIVQAAVAENVALIKSIPAQYHKDIEGKVMRAVQTGRDLGGLAADLEKTYGVTKRRAAIISQSQNNMATAAITRARQIEVGIVGAVWRHSGGGRVPRPTHVANDGKSYDVAKGWFDPAVKRFILPGELPSCRCVSMSIIPGIHS